MNLSTVDDNKTANTKYICALQRAENLSIFGVKTVLELMCGPSLKTLEKAYAEYGIRVVGNDIDPRWKKFYPQGKWIIGDACKLTSLDFDAVVVAPPLSRGCTGQREDALSIDEVSPAYDIFFNVSTKIIVYVLPGRTLSTKYDRTQLYKFLSKLNGNISVVPLVNKINKYIDVYVSK